MENILVSDGKGVVYEGRTEGMDPIKERYARKTSARTLGDHHGRRGHFPRIIGRRRCSSRKWSRGWLETP